MTDDVSNNVIGVTVCGTICCSSDNAGATNDVDVGATLPFKGGGSLLEVQAGVSEKDLMLVGEVTGGVSFVRGEAKPSRNLWNRFINNDNGVAGGNEFSCPLSNPESDAMVSTNGNQFQDRIRDKITC